MNRHSINKKKPFKINETGYHRLAKEELSRWVGGITEQPFNIEGSIVFVPDVVCYKNNILDSIYEVVYSHPLTGRKLAMIQYWCYRNATELTVREVSADYILKQTGKLERIETMECYIINPFDYIT